MRTPDEFRTLVAAFYQHSKDDYATEFDWISSRLGILSEIEKQVVKNYLDYLLTSGRPDSEVQRAWRSGNSCYLFRGHDLRAFLMELRTLLSQAPSSRSRRLKI